MEQARVTGNPTFYVQAEEAIARSLAVRAEDNAAAEARKAINFYGADACFTAYVWRDAFPGDHVCVTPAVRSQTAIVDTAMTSRATAHRTKVPGID